MSKVDRETALEDFERMCASRDVDTDAAEWTEEDRSEFDAIKGVVVKAICKGQLTVDGDGNPTVVLLRPFTDGDKEYRTLAFSEPRMSQLTAGDKHDLKQQTKRAICVLAAMCETSPSACEKMSIKDGQLALKIVNLFLA